MIKEDYPSRIQKELIALKAEEVRAKNDLRTKWHSGMATYAITQELERGRKRRVELETALKILEEFK